MSCGQSWVYEDTVVKLVYLWCRKQAVCWIQWPHSQAQLHWTVLRESFGLSQGGLSGKKRSMDCCCMPLCGNTAEYQTNPGTTYSVSSVVTVRAECNVFGLVECSTTSDIDWSDTLDIEFEEVFLLCSSLTALLACSVLLLKQPVLVGWNALEMHETGGPVVGHWTGTMPLTESGGNYLAATQSKIDWIFFSGNDRIRFSLVVEEHFNQRIHFIRMSEWNASMNC